MNQEICQQLSNKFIDFFKNKYSKIENITPEDRLEIELFLKYFSTIFVDKKFVIVLLN